MRPFRNFPIVFLFTLITWLIIFCIAKPGEANTHHLKGKVEIEGGKTLKEIVVFLESVGNVSPSRNPRKFKVTQKGRKFLPDLLVITKGDIIQYLNDEDLEIDHNIYSLSQVNSFDLGLGERGSILEEKFYSIGKVNYFCSVHKFMGGKVLILPTRYFVLLKNPGSFILPDVPEGKWKLNVFVSHRRYKFNPIEIVVGKNGLDELALEVTKK
ncbi:MAG: cupredoxin domain-containing protein [Nitrospinales bacterium]